MSRPEVTQRDDGGRIFSNLYPSLRRFAGVVAPVEVGPDDLLHEAVERALRHKPLADFDDPGAYLRRTMVNLASNDRRRAVRQAAPVRRCGPG